MIRPKRKNEIETAISNNVAPTRSKSSNDLLLRIGKGYAKLQTRNKTTPAGRFFFAQTNTKPETYDIVGNVVQRGSTEYLITAARLACFVVFLGTAMYILDLVSSTSLPRTLTSLSTYLP